MVRNGKNFPHKRYAGNNREEIATEVVEVEEVDTRGRTKRNLSSSFNVEDEDARESMQEMGTNFMESIWG